MKVSLLTEVQLYLASESTTITNFFMIKSSQFANIDNNNDSIVDALWCQSAKHSYNIGLWYFPNGSQVPLFTGNFGNTSAPSPVFSKQFMGQVALARKTGLAGYEGLYQCIIPDKNGANNTLVVGIYRGNKS